MREAVLVARTVEPDDASAVLKVLLPTAVMTLEKSREVSVEFLNPSDSATKEKWYTILVLVDVRCIFKPLSSCIRAAESPTSSAGPSSPASTSPSPPRSILRLVPETLSMVSMPVRSLERSELSALSAATREVMKACLAGPSKLATSMLKVCTA